jgi:hypothetical protein
MSLRASRTLLRTAVLARCALTMHGQTANTGAIAGTVSDPSGALAPSAAVVIKSHPPHIMNSTCTRFPKVSSPGTQTSGNEKSHQPKC